MNTDVLDLSDAFDSPSSYTEDIHHWSGLLLEKLKACENYDIIPNFGICHGLRNLYLALLRRRSGNGYFFDSGLFATFAFIILAFLFTSIYTIFVEDKKSLKEISNKVRRTTDAIMAILRSFWILKEVKVSNLKLEEECKKILKLKLPQNFFEGGKMKSLTAGKYISTAEITDIDEVQINEVLFTQEEDFPVESDWIPSDKKDNENTAEAASNIIEKSDQGKENLAESTDSNEKKPSSKENIPIQNQLSSISSNDICIERKPVGLEMIPEVNLSDAEDISPKQKWIGRRPKIPGSGRIMLPPYPKEFHMEIRKPGPIKGGIFEHRRQNIERARRTKSFEENPYRDNWDSRQTNNSQEYTASKILPGRSGVLNRSTHKFPLPPTRSVK